MKPRIGVDVSDLCTNRADGTTRYTRELFLRLPDALPEVEFHWLAPCPQPAGDIRGRWHASPWPRWWTQSRLPLELYRQPLDVLFMPIQQVPLVRPRKTKVVSIVHDLAFHYFPQQFRYKDWALLHFFTAHAVRVADHIVADSASTAADIAREYGRKENVSTVHLGVDLKAYREPSLPEREEQRKKLMALNPALGEDYVLFVGQIQPRKNIIGLVDAFVRLRKEHPNLKLVIAGRHGWLQGAIEKHIRASEARDAIVRLTTVTDDLLPALYAQAKVFVLPSLYEGFGLPVIEAMACGTPVVASNQSSLPELVGDAAILCDPFSVESITTSLAQALREPEKFKQAGLARVQAFGWEKTVQQLGDLLQSVLTKQA